MGRRGSHRRESNLPSVQHKPFSLREAKAGKKQVTTTNVKSKLKLEHLQSLAVWAGGEGSVPSLAALFGHRLASANEALGLQPEPSFFSCQRCETVIQPGFNCTIRIKKNQAAKTFTQNMVVYRCHFCSHCNLKRGTPEGHMKEISPPKAQPHSKPEAPKAKPHSKPEGVKSPFEQSTNIVKVTSTTDDEVSKADEKVLPEIPEDSSISTSPITTSLKAKITLEGKKRRRNKPGTKNSSEPDSDSAVTDDKTVGGASSKRRRRTSWTSLKEIAVKTEYDKRSKCCQLTNPFLFVNMTNFPDQFSGET